MMIQARRKWLGCWLVMLGGLVLLHGCSSNGPEVRTEPPLAATDLDTLVPVASGPDPAPPPVVPVGIDTSFVVEVDSTFGIVLNADTLATLETETRQIETREMVVDTLAAVARFLQLAGSGDPRHAMSAADSQAVGHLILRGMAGEDRGAALMLGLEQTVRALDAMAQRSDSLGGALEWDSADPARRAESREVKVAVLGFSHRSSELRAQLEELQGGLGFRALTADSARTQQAVGRLVQEFTSDLDRLINDLGRASRNISAGALSPGTLRGLQENLESRRGALLEFEARWQQFRQMGSFELANPGQPYDAGHMIGLLQQMEKDLGYLATLAGNRAAALDTASSFQTELAGRREAEEYIGQVQKTLIDLKKRNRDLGAAYGRLAARYWKDRLQQVAGRKEEREDLYARLEAMVARAGGAARIRESADLLSAYRQSSDRLLDLRRTHLRKVTAHDRLREGVQAALAADLFNRARVLGEPEDYTAALAAYEEMARLQPGQHTWLYQLATLTWSRSQEPWAAVTRDSLTGAGTVAAASRAATSGWLDRCEEVLLQRHAFDTGMDEAQTLLGEDASASNAAQLSPAPAARAALFLPDDERWYYRRFLTRARDDLASLGAAVQDPEVRRWLLNIDILRKRLAFEQSDGDAFLYRYSRQAMLSEDLDEATVSELLRHWSWDDGHLALRRRWADVSQLPDSTVALAGVKRDSLLALAEVARTEGVRRQIAWSVGTTEFLETGQYDAGLERMHALLKEVEARPTIEPEVGSIDSTIAAVYPVFLYNRGTYYQQEGLRREAFYCFLGVAEQYATDLKTVATARYSAASVLADGNKRGALTLLRGAINEALRVIEDDPRAFDMETLVAMYELRQGLAGDLGLFQEAVRARDEAGALKGLLDQASLNVEGSAGGEVGP